MAASKSFIEAVQERRSVYTLSPESPISDDRIVEIVETAIKSAPSSFNSQSTRAVVLLKKEHAKLWEETKTILKAIVPAEAFPSTEQRINGFKNAYGTILWFEDPAPVKALQEKLPLYADKFPVWSEHTSAIHQYIVWTALEAEGLGANLQHYNPLIDQKIQAEWNVPAEWSLKAQLVFGKPTAAAGEKSFQPLEERLKVYGK
ncbi:MAG: hypothetical protein M1819_006698 [Sarea resinae]|nr:MAG: hypothetical protein M1819_006698 [Sarea resinae]